MATILITGAGGSLGSVLTRRFVVEGYKVRALDIHEPSLSKLKNENVRLLLGDIKDESRMNFALEGCDSCIACASYKNLDLTEYSLEDTYKTNVLGTLKTAKACHNQKVKNAVLISSDKAVEPTSIYGVTKLAQEHIWLWMARVQMVTEFIIIRMGNIEWSSGSVLPIWKEQVERGEKITVTHPQCERYFISDGSASDFVLNVTQTGINGKIYIPKMTRKRIRDMALEFVSNDADKIVITGLRHGEKIMERLYSQEEAPKVKDRGNYYEI
ncbi:MAG: SDR family NAD(P)-dependent oxidoreductase [Methanolobus sp.]|uniref:SDR family NAD(P)-dependent oxidoreductase n=1 Tax=Methanolobus sp. TaxID=1874737 RepID=UPI002731A38E|nr:SDR family NAD(P)-dependent oxidoreductase [Methanolobus sp.]MDP2217206.1 SDR family NAD(P)-dependent oxidoreductase [Methanolobus sp.]